MYERSQIGQGPPIAREGYVYLATPLQTLNWSGLPAQTKPKWSSSQLASLTPMMPGSCAHRIVVAAVMFTAVRPTMLYMIVGPTSEIALKCWYMPSCGGLL